MKLGYRLQFFPNIHYVSIFLVHKLQFLIGSMVTHLNNYVSFAAYRCDKVLANEINEQEMHRVSSVYEGPLSLSPLIRGMKT